MRMRKERWKEFSLVRKWEWREKKLFLRTFCHQIVQLRSSGRPEAQLADLVRDVNCKNIIWVHEVWANESDRMFDQMWIVTFSNPTWHYTLLKIEWRKVNEFRRTHKSWKTENRINREEREDTYYSNNVPRGHIENSDSVLAVHIDIHPEANSIKFKYSAIRFFDFAQVET